MTNLDALDAKFADAVFSGLWDPIPPADEEAFVVKSRIPCPGWVVVARAEAPPVEDGNWVELRLHEGMVYLCAPAPGPLEAWLREGAVLHGEAFEYLEARDFLRQLREAIVSLRCLELRLPRGAERGKIPYHEELQSNALALRELRRTGRTGPAFEAWIELVFERHQRVLHQLRLRLFELLTALSSSADAGQQLGYVIQSGIRRLLEAYTLPQLREVSRAAAGEAAALVALQSGREPGTAPGETSPLVRRALAHIHGHFTEPVSLAEIAVAAHASPEHLAREFRRRVGRTVVEALQLLRINHARQLLTETDRTVLDIAFSSGFESAEHFYRTFRKLAGTTPRTYRQRHTILR